MTSIEVRIDATDLFEVVDEIARLLEKPNVPAHVRETAERIIAEERSVDMDGGRLVATPDLLALLGTLRAIQ